MQITCSNNVNSIIIIIINNNNNNTNNDSNSNSNSNSNYNGNGNGNGSGNNNNNYNNYNNNYFLCNLVTTKPVNNLLCADSVSSTDVTILPGRVCFVLNHFNHYHNLQVISIHFKLKVYFLINNYPSKEMRIVVDISSVRHQPWGIVVLVFTKIMEWDKNSLYFHRNNTM